MKRAGEIGFAIPSEKVSQSPRFSDKEAELINYFFRILETQYGPARFNARFGRSTEELSAAKRLWAPHILKHTRSELSDLVHLAIRRQIEGKEKFQWPDVAAILGQGENHWQHAAQSRPAHEVLNAPPVDRGEALPLPDGAPRTAEEFFNLWRANGLLKTGTARGD